MAGKSTLVPAITSMLDQAYNLWYYATQWQEPERFEWVKMKASESIATMEWKQKMIDFHCSVGTIDLLVLPGSIVPEQPSVLKYDSSKFPVSTVKLLMTSQIHTTTLLRKCVVSSVFPLSLSIGQKIYLHTCPPASFHVITVFTDWKVLKHCHSFCWSTSYPLCSSKPHPLCSGTPHPCCLSKHSPWCSSPISLSVVVSDIPNAHFIWISSTNWTD
jgi:hypothetical protein